MASPIPKFPEHRRNTSKKAAGEWVDLLVPRLENASQPPLPIAGKNIGANPFCWTASDKARWDSWRFDPVSEYWSEADIRFALETLLLYPPHEEKPAHPEIRRRLTDLALTPIGKRNQRFRICFASTRDTTLDVGDEKEIAENVVEMNERRNRLAG